MTLVVPAVAKVIVLAFVKTNAPGSPPFVTEGFPPKLMLFAVIALAVPVTKVTVDVPAALRAGSSVKNASLPLIHALVGAAAVPVESVVHCTAALVQVPLAVIPVLPVGSQ